jgi:aerobic-type carbon monoxide dehydrogenase small subunit (CoxS/CutS family)
MYSLTVNGQVHHPDRDSNLLDYLRDELRLTSVKDGCSAPAST